MLQIKTSDLNKVYKVEVDGQAWTMKAPGAGDELKMGQAQRRIALIDKKIKDGVAVEADYDLYDELERSMFTIFTKIFKDGTDDNSQVEEWVKNTPLAVIIMATESIKEQANAGTTS
jgi:hypothetical protein